MVVADGADIGITRVLATNSCGVGDHVPDNFLHHGRLFSKRDGVSIALAHFAPIGARQFGDLREQGLRFRKDRAVKIIEPANNFARELDMGDLVAANGNGIGLVDQNVCRLKQRVT